MYRRNHHFTESQAESYLHRQYARCNSEEVELDEDGHDVRYVCGSQSAGCTRCA